MPKFFKVKLEDIDELYDICNEDDERESTKKYSAFVGKNQYYTCTNCGREELYDDSPVVKDEIWEEACDRLGIDFLNGENEKSSHLIFYNTDDMTKEQRKAYDFLQRYKAIRTVTPDSDYTMLCRHCIEKGIGRKLYKEDLVDCGMTRKMINRFESKPIKPFKDF